MGPIITIMVTFSIISEYSQDPPTQTGLRVKIALGRPLYELARVQALAEDVHRIKAVTQKCLQDVEKLFAGEYDDVASLICALRPNDYRDSEWCESGRASVAACDAYVVQRVEVAPGSGQSVAVMYYLKFAIGKTGQLVLMVSCHLS